jgi:hypothetical protein
MDGGDLIEAKLRFLHSGATRVRLLVTVVAALLAAGVAPVHAVPMTSLSETSETVDLDLDKIDCDPTPAELEDIEFIAEQDGIPLDEAVARYGWQSCFVEVTGYLREAYADQYAGAAITNGGRGAWVAFKSNVPEEAAELAAAIPVTVRLTGGRGFSEVELNQTLESVYADISSHEDVVASTGSYDIETGVITVQAQPRETLTDPSQREGLREVLQSEQPANSAITVEVIIVDELAMGGDTSEGRAGAPLTRAVYAGLLTVVVLALLSGMLMRRRRRMSR